MKQFFTCLLTTALCWTIGAQTTATFESFELEPGSFLNGSDDSGGFADGNIFLPNTYDSEFDFWSGWAISTSTDTLTAGFTNQYSAVSGSGVDGSATYAVTFAAPSTNLILTGAAEGGPVEGLFVNNGTYAYLSMLNGDSFAKKFGGESGDDPDYFLLTIKKYLNGELSIDSIDFYLADYRFEDNSLDYLVKEWTFIDVSVLGNADSLQFSLTSSDVGQFGINTPTYFCLDNVTTADQPTATKKYLTDVQVEIFPNPTPDRVLINWQEPVDGRIELYGMAGQLLQRQVLNTGQNEVQMSHLPAGNYHLKIATADGWLSRLLVKQ